MTIFGDTSLNCKKFQFVWAAEPPETDCDVPPGQPGVQDQEDVRGQGPGGHRELLLKDRQDGETDVPTELHGLQHPLLGELLPGWGHLQLERPQAIRSLEGRGEGETKTHKLMGK